MSTFDYVCVTARGSLFQCVLQCSVYDNPRKEDSICGIIKQKSNDDDVYNATHCHTVSIVKTRTCKLQETTRHCKTRNTLQHIASSEDEKMHTVTNYSN